MRFSIFPNGFDHRHLKNVALYSAVAVILMITPTAIAAFVVSVEVRIALLFVGNVVCFFAVALLFSLLGFRRNPLQPFFISAGALFTAAWIAISFEVGAPQLDFFSLTVLLLGGLLLLRSVSRSWCVTPPLVPTRR